MFLFSSSKSSVVMFKMTVVEAYFEGKRMDPPDNVGLLSSNTASLLIEGIAQNTTGSVFEPEVKLLSFHHPIPVQLSCS